MPANDGKSAVWYVILEEKNNELTFEHKWLTYNFTLTNSLMLKNDLPNEYAKTIVTGIWDNMEILPEVEANLQGLNLQF
jgi:hypothetical protein